MKLRVVDVIGLFIAVALIAFMLSQMVKINSLEEEIDRMNKDIDTGVLYISTVPRHGNALYMSSEKPFLDRGVWFIVAPNGTYQDRANATNIAGFQVWRSDPTVKEYVDNLEWLEIGSGSPCWGEDSFVISANRFGDGIARDIVFGAMRMDSNSHQKAFVIKATDNENIYTRFDNDLLIYRSLLSTPESKLGLFGVEPVGQQEHIEYADEYTIVEKFNELLEALENYGLVAR